MRYLIADWRPTSSQNTVVIYSELSDLSKYLRSSNKSASLFIPCFSAFLSSFSPYFTFFLFFLHFFFLPVFLLSSYTYLLLPPFLPRPHLFLILSTCPPPPLLLSCSLLLHTTPLSSQWPLYSSFYLSVTFTRFRFSFSWDYYIGFFYTRLLIN